MLTLTTLRRLAWPATPAARNGLLAVIPNTRGAQETEQQDDAQHGHHDYQRRILRRDGVIVRFQIRGNRTHTCEHTWRTLRTEEILSLSRRRYWQQSKWKIGGGFKFLWRPSHIVIDTTSNTGLICRKYTPPQRLSKCGRDFVDKHLTLKAANITKFLY